MSDAKSIILVEIASAWDLISSHDDLIDPYCVCSLAESSVPVPKPESLIRDKLFHTLSKMRGSSTSLLGLRLHEIHKTETVPRTGNPIWTLSTNSLFLLDMAIHKKKIADGLHFEVKHVNLLGRAISLGSVLVPYAIIVAGNSERKEFRLRSDKNGKPTRGTLALRFRHATKDDQYFIKRTPFHRVERCIDCSPEIPRHLPRKPSSKEKLYRVKPYPDPNDIHNTTWLSKDEIEETCMKPSTYWEESGVGRVGRLFLEIIKCDEHPDASSILGPLQNLTKTRFVKIILEDNHAQTDIIPDYEEFHGRWMPWMKRAFIIPVYHPDSPILLGVFDHNIFELTEHIGRVVIDLTRLRSEVEYVLTYDLYVDDRRKTEPSGTITVRLHLEWTDDQNVLNASLSTPPRFLINTDDRNDYKMIRYLCEGEINIEKPSGEAIKSLFIELESYGPIILYQIDVLVQIILWRGNMDFKIASKTISIWLPINSIVLFICGVTLAENLHLLPSFVFFGATWILCNIMLTRKYRPSPWTRCLTFTDVVSILLFHSSSTKNFHISAFEGDEATKELEMLTKLKIERVTAFFSALIKSILKFRRKYRVKSVDTISIETKDDSYVLFGKYLYYIHLPMYYLCFYLRSTSAWVTWNLWSKAFQYNVVLALLSIVSLFLDWGLICRWWARMIFWSLGPWMKLVDLHYVKAFYQTDEDLKKTKKVKEPEAYFDAIFETEALLSSQKKRKIVLEDATKLKDIRSVLFGEFSEKVPSSVVYCGNNVRDPRPESNANYCDRSLHYSHLSERAGVTMKRVPGQKVIGNMIHTLDGYEYSKIQTS